MLPLDVVAVGAVSPLGTGQAAFSVGDVGAPARSAIARDDELLAAGLEKPFAARVRDMHGEDRAPALLARAAALLVEDLDVRAPRWRGRRIGLAVGTSGGGMSSQVRAFELVGCGAAVPPELARAAAYFGPLRALEQRLAVDAVERTQILAACASSTVAIAVAARWLELGRADLVIAGGYDALCVFIAAGFEVLGATSALQPAPFRRDRDGMALGEGAALLALARAEGAPVNGLRQVLGVGMSSDAVHITAPDRTGAGLASAARAALADAAADAIDVDLISAHGTATPFNDAAETRALEAVLGDRLRQVVIHPFKGVVGHCLGAGGALESLAALDAIERGVLPAAVGDRPVDPDLGVRLITRNQAARPELCLKLSAAFGGANAALVLGRARVGGVPRARRPVHLVAIGPGTELLDFERVAATACIDRARLARFDPVSSLAVAAVAGVLAHVALPLAAGAGIVLGTSAATLEVNAAYESRIRAKGARWAEPRRFPATSPNLAVGQCSIAFQLRGPAFAVGWDGAAPTEAFLVAYDLVAAGDAEQVVVVAADDVGGVVESIWDAAGWPRPAHGAAAVVIGASPAGPRIDREKLWTCHRAARVDGGRVGGAEPGWPSLLAAAERAGGQGLAH